MPLRFDRRGQSVDVPVTHACPVRQFHENREGGVGGLAHIALMVELVPQLFPSGAIRPVTGEAAERRGGVVRQAVAAVKRGPARIVESEHPE